MRTTFYSIGAAVLAFSLAGCAHKPQSKNGNGLTSARPDDGSDDGGPCAARVHFEYDSTEIAEADRARLVSSARCLKDDPGLRALIEGNADERGTEEYNLALGDRRATTVAKYLTSLGAEDGQIKTVSYGEENPVCTDHQEPCWSKNRRAAVRPRAPQPTSSATKEAK